MNDDAETRIRATLEQMSRDFFEALHDLQPFTELCSQREWDKEVDLHVVDMGEQCLRRAREKLTAIGKTIDGAELPTTIVSKLRPQFLGGGSSSMESQLNDAATEFKRAAGIDVKTAIGEFTSAAMGANSAIQMASRMS